MPSPCPEGEYRASLSDADFWAHVYPQPDDYDWSEWEPEDLAVNAKLADPCPECGQYGACSYDSEGRALIHVIVEEGELNG